MQILSLFAWVSALWPHMHVAACGGLVASGGMWRSVAAPGGSWRPLAASVGPWQPLAASGGLWRAMVTSGGLCQPVVASGGLLRSVAPLAAHCGLRRPLVACSGLWRDIPRPRKDVSEATMIFDNLVPRLRKTTTFNTWPIQGACGS